MLKSHFITLITTLLFLFSNTQTKAQGITFEHSSWADVQAKAKQENKPIFVDCYTTWCGPCKWMAKEIFSQEAIGNYFKENFIAYKLDMQKGEGPEFAKAYKVAAFPTLLYFSAAGELIHKAVGARDSAQLMALCKDAIDPDKQLSSFRSKYEKGERSKAFMKAYLEALSNAGETERAVFDTYWKDLSQEEKISAEGLQLIRQATSGFYDYKDPIVQFFASNLETFNQTIGEDQVIYSLLDMQYHAERQALEEKNPEKRALIIKEILPLIKSSEEELTAKINFREIHHLYYSEKKDFHDKAYQDALGNYMKITKDENELNLWAWNTYERETAPKYLKIALKWVNRSVKIKAGYANVDTQAAILFKLGKAKKAKSLAEQAIKLGEEEGYNKEGMKGTYELLEKIKAAL